ncbi:MAG: type II toxin-antitoxin system RelE/ParE family toxin [Clostridia bacterium]|nr:type II toxin-antitoxin system RelE/ParE family toxin [Clostridia bacterium]MDH7573614.1 type II toxin-antitoxin system RelE/ParE family toxin [Clostridia bacterium]
MTEWQVIILQPARRYLERLPRKEQKRILNALQKLQEDPRQVLVKPLKGRPEWSLRVGGRRVLIMVDKKQKRLVITTIGPRGDVY